MNRFIKWIWDARNIDEKNRKQAKKHYYSFSDTMDQLKHSSPGFQDLWDISDFLNIIEYTYFYNNTRESGFWSDGEFGVGKTRFNIISIIWDKFIPLVYRYYKKNNTYCIEEEYRMHW